MTIKKDKELLNKILLSKLADEDKIKTGIIELDTLLSGGLMSNTLTQIVGETSTGKTMLVLQIAHSFCKQDKVVLFIDTKGDVNSEMINTVRLEEYRGNKFFYVCETKFKTVEEILDTILIEQHIDLIIIDSIAGITNSGYLNLGSKGIKVDNNNSNYDSRPLALLVNKVKKLAIERKLCVLITNEFRNKIQVYGNKGTITKIYGPKKLQYETTNIIQINQLKENSPNGKTYRELFKPLQSNGLGKVLEFQIVKSNVAKPDTRLPAYFEYGRGFSKIIPVVFMLYNRNLLIKNGSYYELKSSNIKTNGIINLVDVLDKQINNIDYTDNSEFINFYKALIKNQSARSDD